MPINIRPYIDHAYLSTYFLVLTVRLATTTRQRSQRSPSVPSSPYTEGCGDVIACSLPSGGRSPPAGRQGAVWQLAVHGHGWLDLPAEPQEPETPQAADGQTGSPELTGRPSVASPLDPRFGVIGSCSGSVKRKRSRSNSQDLMYLRYKVFGNSKI